MSVQVTHTSKQDNQVLQSILKAPSRENNLSPIDPSVRGLITGIHPPVKRTGEEQIFFDRIKNGFSASLGNVTSYSEAVCQTALKVFCEIKTLNLNTPVCKQIADATKAKIGLPTS